MGNNKETTMPKGRTNRDHDRRRQTVDDRIALLKDEYPGSATPGWWDLVKSEMQAHVRAAMARRDRAA